MQGLDFLYFCKGVNLLLYFSNVLYLHLLENDTNNDLQNIHMKLRHDIAEILLKVTLSTKNQSLHMKLKIE
jgi:hypothetical protein